MTTPNQPNKNLTSRDIRQMFVDYFAAHDHQVISSYSLVPANDPTLMFTNAGMVQFKDVFAGSESPSQPRATTFQKCVRAGGKHNDLENVGKTARHHTFFEMLGNFSFGDYFKEDAIKLAWQFLTETLGLDASRMWATVFVGEEGIPADEEAYTLWTETVGLPNERVLRLGMKDNFWSMGDTGPCGPCSEILYDLGPEASEPGNPDAGDPALDGERFLEVWNLVFMQFNRHEDGTMDPLPAPSIDTGMGLERITAVIQQKLTNYDTDLFQPLLQFTAKGIGKQYGEDENDSISMRVIADHARATAFLIADGVYPSNEGSGYVLRRIMRRAIRHGEMLGYQEPFFHEVCAQVIALMHETYPELDENAEAIKTVAKNEEVRFRHTLSHGLKLLQEELTALLEKGSSTLPGEIVFRLYDTYGFPVDLTRVICEEQSFTIDEAGFEEHMEAQRQRGRDSWTGQTVSTPEELQSLLEQVGPTEFLGYTQEEASAELLAILHDGETLDTIEANEGDDAEPIEVQLVFNRTPFYAESGGQVGDQGTLTHQEGAQATITDTKKPLPELFVHHASLHEGSLRVGQHVHLHIDQSRRTHIRRNHSATHLLHWALRTHLGTHVKQAGSLVDPERLRFDYTHFQTPTEAQIQTIEDDVNRLIRENHPVVTQLMGFDQAKEAGAMALFGEKYGDEVRMLRIGPSLELCGGTHTERSGDIGQFRLISEQGVAAGTRRIEAYTGVGADQLTQHWSHTLQQSAGILRCRTEEIPSRIEKLQNQLKQLSREVEQLKIKAAQTGNQQGDPLDQVQQQDGISYLALRVDLGEPKAMRELADQLRDRLKSGIVVLAGVHKDKASLCAVVTEDLTPKLHAGKIIQQLAKSLDGKGGGRPNMAQGGGPSVDKIDPTLQSLGEIIAQMNA